MVITPLVEDRGMPSRMPSNDRWPTLFRHPEASAWLQIQTDLGLAPRTLDAYARGLEDYLVMCRDEPIDPIAAGRADIARFALEATES